MAVGNFSDDPKEPPLHYYSCSDEGFLLVDHRGVIRQHLRIGHAGIEQPPDEAGEHDRAGAIHERAEDLAHPLARERDPTIGWLPAHPLRDVQDPEAHVPALVARDELEDPAQQRMRRVLTEALEDAHREALEEELLGGDQLERIVHREQGVEHHLGPGVDVLDLLVHRVDEAAVREMVPGFVHRLRRRVVAVVFLAERQDQLGADVLRHALPDLQDIEHATDRATGRVDLHRLGQRLERRRLPVRGPPMGDERVVGLDRESPVDIVLEVPVGRMSLGKEGVDAGMTGIVQLQQFTRSHGALSARTVTRSPGYRKSAPCPDAM